MKMKEILTKELKFLAIVFAIVYIFFQIHYFKENILVVLNTVVAHFYLFILPGYSLALIFYGKINNIERLIIGVGLGYGLQPFLLYAINFVVKINIMKYNMLVSGLLILLGLYMFNKKLKK